MSKYRIYELAKDYNTTSKVIIDILARNSIVAKNHMSSVGDDAKTVIERAFARKTSTAETADERIQKISANTDPVGARQSTEQGELVSHTNRNHTNTQTSQPSRQPTGTFRHSNNPSFKPATAPNQASGRQQRYQSGSPTAHKTPHQSRPGSFPQNQPQNQFHNQRSAAKQQNAPGTFPNQQIKTVSPPSGSLHNKAGSTQPKQQFRSNGGVQQLNEKPGRTNIQQPVKSFKPSQPRFEQPDKNFKREGQTQQIRERQQATAQGNTGKRPAPQQGSNRMRQQRPNQSALGHQPASQSVPKSEPVKPKVVKLAGNITVKELAAKFGREVSEVIKKLMMLGVMASINQEVDIETAQILGEDFGITVEMLPPEEDPTEIPEIDDAPGSLLSRPPVVTIMGHVDHGKTSLLDAIRQTNVTSQEAGGITQHIGAYQVTYQNKKIVFLDTPGHEAFTAMRARGAQVTDIAILVVAADDGVMPQTIEAINHAKSAKVPIIVAINKMDRPGANPERVKQQISEHGLIPEDWGGDTIMVPVSAHKKTGLNDLLEMILLVAEMQELKANPSRSALGTIIEAQLDKGRGPVATVLVQKGTLHIGDSIIAGTAFGKVRAMINDRGDKVKKATPSTPVEVLGLSDVPQAGDILVAVDEKIARAVAEKRATKKRSEEMGQAQKVSLDDIFKQIQEGTLKDLNIVIKADVQGSIEALRQALLGLKNKEVRVNIVHSGVGAINESDVMLAAASNALIIGFNVRPDANARKAADNEKIDIRTYRVIYEAINDVEAAMTGMLAPEYKEVIQGRVEVRKVISVPKAVVAGSYVLEGKITNSSKIRIIRNGIVVHEGEIESLRRFKDEVKEVVAGYECGISIEKYRDVKESDIIEAYTMELVKHGS